jgi:choline dehydrogenase-like flavoprotein
MPLSASARACLIACAEASLPAGERLPAADVTTVARLEEGLTQLPRAAALALEGLTRAADAMALRDGRRALASLPIARRFERLEAWRTSRSYPVRQSFRLLMTALKAAHYSDPRVATHAPCQRPEDHVQAEPTPAWMGQVVDLGAPGGDESLEADVVIIGSGAGGAAAARTLASAGLAVVVIEAGAFHRRHDFVGSVLTRTARLYARMGLQATIGNVSIALPTGEAVGGSTTINAGTCLRTPPWVLRDWREQHSVPLEDAEIEPYFERVERWLEVSVPEARHLGMQATIIARGADALGLAHGPLARNAPGCDGQGLCYFGCPTGAKRSADVSLIPPALSSGAMLFTRARVEGIARAAGGVRIEARAASGRLLKVKARAAILAAGALATPLLLARAGVRHPWLGANLSIHPAAAAIGLFPFDVHMDRAIPQGYGLEGLREQGLLFEGGATPFELTALALDLHGPRLVEVLEQHHRLLTYGFNVRDASRGRVRRGPGGAPLPTYELGAADVAQLQFGLRTLLDLLARGGATHVFPPIAGLDEVPAERAGRALDGRVLRATDLELSAYHPLGTARMGGDPARSVVDMDLRLRDWPELLVCDGSVVPTSMGANPQITIMSLATRAAERLANALA